MVPFPIRDGRMGEEGSGGIVFLPKWRLKGNLMQREGVRKMQFRPLPACEPAGTQALRGQGLCLFTPAVHMPRIEKVLSRELVNEAMKRGTHT